MSRNAHHVVPNPRRGWTVKKSGAVRATRVFDTQDQAITYARDLSRAAGSELYVHHRDGTIRSKDSYGTDPFPPKG